jgi:hypothetical protein
MAEAAAMPAGLSAKQQKLFELRMRMVRIGLDAARSLFFHGQLSRTKPALSV